MAPDPKSPPAGEQKPQTEPAPAQEHPVDQETQEDAARDREDAKGYS